MHFGRPRTMFERRIYWKRLVEHIETKMWSFEFFTGHYGKEYITHSGKPWLFKSDAIDDATRFEAQQNKRIKRLWSPPKMVGAPPDEKVFYPDTIDKAIWKDRLIWKGRALEYQTFSEFRPLEEAFRTKGEIHLNLGTHFHKKLIFKSYADGLEFQKHNPKLGDRKMALPKNTRVRVIKNNSGHSYEIGKLYFIDDVSDTGSTNYFLSKNENSGYDGGGIIRESDLEVVEGDAIKVLTEREQTIVRLKGELNKREKNIENLKSEMKEISTIIKRYKKFPTREDEFSALLIDAQTSKNIKTKQKAIKQMVEVYGLTIPKDQIKY